jgi:hypothetical protein
MTTNPDELVERLRRGANGDFDVHPFGDYGLYDEAADRITSLQDHIAQLEEAGEAMAGALEQAKGYIDGNHDEGCELDPEFGEQNMEAREANEDDEPLDDGPAHCTCGADEVLSVAQASLTNWRAAQESKS